MHCKVNVKFKANLQKFRSDRGKWREPSFPPVFQTSPALLRLRHGVALRLMRNVKLVCQVTALHQMILADKAASSPLLFRR